MLLAASRLFVAETASGRPVMMQRLRSHMWFSSHTTKRDRLHATRLGWCASAASSQNALPGTAGLFDLGQPYHLRPRADTQTALWQKW